MDYTFIFADGQSNKSNQFFGFRRDFNLACIPKTLALHITARSFYRLFINGRFVCHGAARAGFNHVRMDVIDVLSLVSAGTNRIAVEVAGYANAYDYSNNITCESGMLAGCLFADGEEILRTDSSWSCRRLHFRRTDAPRYSHCREINEYYNLDESYASWRTEDADEQVEVLKDNPVVLERRVPYPDYRKADGFKLIEFGSVTPDCDIAGLTHETHAFMHEKLAPLKGDLRLEDNCVCLTPAADGTGISLFYDMGVMMTGFKGISFTAEGDGVIDFIHAEEIRSDGVIYNNPSMIPALRLCFKKGSYNFLSFEPYAMRYLKVIVRAKNPVTISGIYVKQYTFPDNHSSGFLCDNGQLNAAWNAARLTLRLNTLDVFMDCPDRERGGWLCDSFWAGRAQHLLFADTSVEKSMLENFLHCPKEDRLEGIIFPSCYPALNPGYLNTWTLWLYLEVFEYVTRSGDVQMLDSYKSSMTETIDKLWDYANEDGLIENPPGFIFIDWSMANHPGHTSPISVPFNALYACLLNQAAKAYVRADWTERADCVLAKLDQYASGNCVNEDRHGFFTNGFIEDALCYSQSGKLRPKSIHSEAGSLTTLWAEGLDKSKHPQVCERVIHGCGPFKNPRNTAVMLAQTNMFIGYCIRLDLLSKYGEYELMLREILKLSDDMLSVGPGTLWECFTEDSSRCHGFMSHIAFLLTKDILGLHPADEINKTIRIAPHCCGLKWAKGTAQTLGGAVSVSWADCKEAFELLVNAPKDYRLIFDLDSIRAGNKIIKCNGKIL